MSRIYTFILTVFLGIAFIACEDDDCDQLHIDGGMIGIPTVMKGSFPVGDLAPAVGDSIVFNPQLLDTTGVCYSWALNGKVVSTDTVFVLKAEKPTRAVLKCTLTNPFGKVELESNITTKHDLTKGVLIAQNGSLDFYDTQLGRLYSDVFESLNYGDGMPLGQYDDFCLVPVNGKYYLLVSTSASNLQHLFVADAKTLSRENSANIAANLNAMIPLNEKQALVIGGGAYRFDLSSLTKIQLYKKYGWGIYNGLIDNGKLLANVTYDDLAKVCWYDVNALLSAKENEMPQATELDIWQNSKANFVRTADGNIYTIGCNEDETAYYIVKIKNDLTTERTLLPFEPLKNGYSTGLYTAGLVLTVTGDAIYIPSADQSVYKYVPGNAASLERPFIGVPEGGEELSGTGVCIDPANGDLWICYAEETGWREYSGRIRVYNAAGKELKSIDCGESAPKAVVFNR